MARAAGLARAAASGQGAREALRAATDGLHRRLHGAPGFDRLLEGRIALRDYAALLVRLHRLHVPLERRLLESPYLRHWGIDMRQRQRAHLLAADLADLGAAPEPDRLARFPEGSGPGWD